MLLILLLLSLLVVLFILYYGRSSKRMPRNWREFTIELKYQYYGGMGFLADVLMKFKNHEDLVLKPGKVAIVTGGNRGIGFEVVKKLLLCDMTVVLGVRNPEIVKKTFEDICKAEQRKGKVVIETCDTAKMESVENFAKKVQERFSEIHVLINNAGVMCTPYSKTKDGFESQMAINHLGHFLLTHLLMPQLKAGGLKNDSQNVRILNVSSCVHKAAKMDYDDFHMEKFYYPVDSYNKSKLAQVYFTQHLDELCRMSHLNIQVHSIHPGIVHTDLFQNCSSGYFPWIQKLFYKTAEQGSRTIVHAAMSPKLEGHGGTYLSNCRIAKATRNQNESRKLFEYSCEILHVKDFMK
ncbi:CLUMA_CG002369, isoform A [Clunio marinus]|uniref:CLUMA_CG002369, isoform A n=1 Tax=Clunio marinus TaxID=568069 RepID=A0A1J1HL96_9DIPT|nr:CLUMA_CG002369, isoform A [Clunio marinus]